MRHLLESQINDYLKDIRSRNVSDSAIHILIIESGEQIRFVACLVVQIWRFLNKSAYNKATSRGLCEIDMQEYHNAELNVFHASSVYADDW